MFTSLPPLNVAITELQPMLKRDRLRSDHVNRVLSHFGTKEAAQAGRDSSSFLNAAQGLFTMMAKTVVRMRPVLHCHCMHSRPLPPLCDLHLHLRVHASVTCEKVTAHLHASLIDDLQG